MKKKLKEKQITSILNINVPDRDLIQFGDYLRKNMDINIDYLKKSHVLRRIKSRIIKSGCKNIVEYLEYLKSNENEKIEIKAVFSINVTHFFRNPDTFEEIRKSLLPKLSKSRTVYIWSAGCADGAEPYTIAMLLKRHNLRPENARILATDYNLKSLKVAQIGKYSADYLKETPEMYRKHFTTINKQDIKIDSSLGRFIDFKIHNLLNDPVIPKIGKNKFDIVLCRNVMIYFDKNHQDMVYQKFYEALKPGGFLILGRSEILLGKWRQRFDIFDTIHRISRKKKE